MLGAVAACVDGGRASLTVGPPADATTGDDADAQADGAAQDATPDLVVADVCGDGPWVTLGIYVVGLTLSDPNGAPLPGVQFTSPLCPGLVQVSDDAGLIRGQVSQNVPFYGRLTAQNFISELAPEEIFDADSTGSQIQMLPQFIEGIILSNFDAAASTAIILAVQKTADDAGACSALDGVSFSVPGHAEAQVQYLSASTIPTPVSGATATTTKGLAVITGLSDGDSLQFTLAGTKPGCHVELQRGSVTGRVPLENGFVTLMPAYLTP
jgi:hypothetical protein